LLLQLRGAMEQLQWFQLMPANVYDRLQRSFQQRESNNKRGLNWSAPSSAAEFPKSFVRWSF
jgi:hypothetical protein